MKKYWTLIFVLVSSLLRGQSFSCGVLYGRAYPSAVKKLPDNLLYYTINDVSMYRHSSVKYSFGEGKQYGVLLNFQINPVLGIGFEGSYLNNPGIEVESSYYLVTNRVARRIGSWSSEAYRLIPQIKFGGQYAGFDFYGKAGVVISKSTIQYKENYTIRWWTDTIDFTVSYTGDRFLGGMFSLGIGREIIPRLNLFFEVRSILQDYSPKRKELIEYRENGVDVLGEKTKYERITEYVDRYHIEDDLLGLHVDENETKKETNIYFPFGAISMNFGITYTFWKYKKKSKER